MYRYFYDDQGLIQQWAQYKKTCRLLINLPWVDSEQKFDSEKYRVDPQSKQIVLRDPDLSQP